MCKKNSEQSSRPKKILPQRKTPDFHSQFKLQSLQDAPVHTLYALEDFAQ